MSAKLKIALFASVCLLFSFFAAPDATAQNRERVVGKPKPRAEKRKTRPTTQIPPSPRARTSRGLTNKIIVVKNKKNNKSLVKKTALSRSNRSDVFGGVGSYSATTRALMMQSIRAKLGVRYRMGTSGPRSYDCSGFVWRVFKESGISFTRTSARQYWRTFKPVYGNDRYKFGTLVFLNRLGHVGIVVDEKGFYHASSSRGVMYSPFKGYWSKRIVGYRRVQ